jgi:hypothetical protein
MRVWQGVGMDSLKFHRCPLCPTLLRPAGGPPPKWPYIRFRGGPPARQAACGRLLPFWTPHAVRLCLFRVGFELTLDILPCRRLFAAGIDRKANYLIAVKKS